MNLLDFHHPSHPAGLDSEEQFKNNAWIFATVLFVVALTFYVATLCRTVFWWDSGELIANAKTLGIAHRPGFPLYVLVGRVFGLIPFGEYFYRINFISAFSAAASLAVLGYVVARVMHVAFPPRATWEKFLLTGLAVGAIAGTYTFWIQAVRAEVYAPSLLVLVLLIACVWCANQDLAAGRADSLRWLCAAGFLGGLGMALHHATFASALPAVVLFLLIAGRGHRPSLRAWMYVAAFGILGLTVYAYLPIRASQHPLLNWGWVPGAGSGGWSNVAATDSYHYIIGTTTEVFVARVQQLLDLLIERLHWGLALLAAVGAVAWLRVACRWSILALGMIAGNIAVSALLVTDFSDTNADIHGYLLPSLAAMAVLMAGGLVALGDLLMGISRRFLPTPSVRRVLWFASMSMILLLVLAPYLISAPFCDLADNRLAYDFGTESTAELPTNAIVFLSGTNWDFVLRGLQYGMDWRRDLVVINRDLLPAAWYRQSLFHNHPHLAKFEIPTDSSGVMEAEWGKQLAKAGYGVYWEFTEVDMALVPHIVPAGHLFELTAEPIDILGPELLEAQEEFESLSLFFGAAEEIPYDYDAQMVWVVNLYRAGMYYESRGLLGRAKDLYQRALSISPGEARLWSAVFRVSPLTRRPVSSRTASAGPAPDEPSAQVAEGP